MYDTNLVDFYARVATFEKSQAKGYGHEAPGTLGRSVTYGLRKTRRRISVMPLVFVVLAAVGLKATILHSVGGAAYEHGHHACAGLTAKGAHPLPGSGWSRQAFAGPFGGRGCANRVF